jgi:FxsC-like protein
VSGGFPLPVGGSRAVGAPAGPLFFLSYAHTPPDDDGGADPDVWVGELYRDLCDNVRQIADLPKGAPAGFMDREMRQGYEWPDRLVNALATCRVFVPLYSRRYFKSENCGKEWFAFNMRRINQRTKIDRPVETIIPALWSPLPDTSLPAAVNSVQHDFSFNQEYAEHGFYGIMKVKLWRGVYEQAALRLAEQIVHAAESAPSMPSSLIPYQELSPAFGDGEAAPADKPLWITVAAPSRLELTPARDDGYYGNDSRAWNPYRGDAARPLAEHAAELARGLSYTPYVGDVFQHSAVLSGREAPSGPGVLLIDPWAALLPECREILQRLDSLDSPWTQVVVVWSQKDAQMRAEEPQLTEALRSALPNKLREGRATHVLAVRGVPSLE